MSKFFPNRNSVRTRFWRRRSQTRQIRAAVSAGQYRIEQLEPRHLLTVAPVVYDTVSADWFETIAEPSFSVDSSSGASAADAVSNNSADSSSKDSASNSWIVRLSPSVLQTVSQVTDAVGLFSSASGLRVLGGLGLPGQLLLESSACSSEIFSYLEGLGWVSSFEQDLPISVSTFSATASPNDPRYGDLYGLHNTGQSGGRADADIDAPEAWGVSTGSRDVIVAVVDTGIDYSHPDLAANMWVNPGEIAGNGIDDDGNGFVDDVYGYDFVNNDGDPFDDQGHGTHCAGTIGGVGNNGTGVVGVNWEVSLMGLKFLSSSGSGSTSDAIQAINYATMMRTRYGQNVRVTSNSWGGGGSSSAMRQAIEAGAAADILFVAAAGNDGSNNDSRPQYPASYTSEAVVSVAATDRNDALASFSNYGATSVDLAAPGVSIVSTVPGGGYASYSGTSMATPHVAGAAALALAVDPTLSVAELKTALFDSVDGVSGLAGRVVTGGRLNAGTLVSSLSSDPTVPTAPGSISASDGTSLGGVQVAWSGSLFADNYTLYRSESADPSSARVLASGLTSTSYLDSAAVIDSVYHYWVTASNDLGTSPLSASDSGFHAGSRSPNNAFADRFILEGRTPTASGSNVDATAEPGEPGHHYGLGGGKSVWWTWTAPAAGTVEINTFGSDYDTVLAVYQGTSVDSLRGITSNDDSGGLQSRVTFTAAQGESYQIAVDGYRGASGSIALAVAIEASEPVVPIDEIALSNTTIAENLPVGTDIGMFTATGGTGVLAFELIAGAGDSGNEFFEIAGSRLRTDAVLDYESDPTHSIRVRATDQEGQTSEQTFLIIVENTSENSFDYGFRHINQENAEDFLVSSSGMRKYSEWQSTPITYWGPAANDVVSEMIYHFPFAARSESIFLKAYSPTWDFGSAQGASAIDVSGNGETWTTLHDNITPENWGTSWRVQELLPDSVVGTDGLWIRMQFLVENASNGSYTVAQFGRSTSAATDNVFEIRATLAEVSPITGVTLDSSNVVENTPVGTVVGEFSATGGSGVTYALLAGDGDTDNESFQIVGSQLVTAQLLDHESDPFKTIRVRASDATGSVLDLNFDVVVENTNEAPTALRLSNASIAEGLPAGTVVGVLSATDPDEAETFTYSFVSGVADGDHDFFEIVGNELRTTTVFDYESRTSYELFIQVTDSGGLTYAPDTPATSLAFLENSDSTDVDRESPLLRNSLSDLGYSFDVCSEIGANELRNALDGAGLLVVPEMERSDVFSAMSADAQGVVRDFVNSGGGLLLAEPYRFSGLNDIFSLGISHNRYHRSSTTLQRDVAVGTAFESAPDSLPWASAVGVYTSLPEGTRSFYENAAGESSVFEIPYGSGSIGVLGFDWFTDPTPSIWETVLDASVIETRGGVSEGFVITVTDEPENTPPTSINLTGSAVVENAPNALVGLLSTVDADATDLFTYELVAGDGDTGNTLFRLDGDRLKTAVALDHEASGTYSIRIRSTDSSGASIEAIFEIVVDDVNEAPTSLQLSNASIAEDAVAGTVVGGFSVEDEDITDTHTFALVAGEGDSSNALFALVDGTLATAEQLDYETASSHSVRVRATDAAGAFVEHVFTINVIDVVEGLLVDQIVTGRDGVTVSFDGPLDLPNLDLHNRAAPPEDLDVTLVDATSGLVDAALAVNATGDGFRLVVSNGLLTAGDYTLRIRSGEAGVVAADGRLLDGDGDGVGGDDFVSSFAVQPLPEGTAIVGVPGFFEDAGQEVSLPAVAGGGIPVIVTAPEGVMSLELEVFYNPALLEVTGVELAAGLPDGSLTLINVVTPGHAVVGFFSPQPLGGGSYAVARLLATVPTSATTDQTHVLDISNVSLNEGLISAVDDDGIHVVAVGNRAPTGINLSSNVVVENSPVGTVIGMLEAIDSDYGDSFTFELVAGEGDGDNAAFSVDGRQLIAMTGFDFEAGATRGIRIRVTDSEGESFERAFTIQIENQVETLYVTGLVSATDGFGISFSSPIDVGALNLYDAMGIYGESDLTLRGATTGDVDGSLVIAADGRSLQFVANAPLALDTYSVIVRSGSDAFQTVTGELLDGNADEEAGDSYNGTFTISEVPAVRLAIPSFARGSGQDVNVPAGSEGGIPLVLESDGSVRSLEAIFSFDPELLEVLTIDPAADLPEFVSFSTEVLEPGRIALRFDASESFPDVGGAPAGQLTIANVMAQVAATAENGSSALVRLESVVVNGTVTAGGSNAVQVVASLGDTSGDGEYSSSDASLAARLAMRLDSGLVSYPVINPSLVADVSGNGTVSMLDAAMIAGIRSSSEGPRLASAPRPRQMLFRHGGSFRAANVIDVSGVLSDDQTSLLAASRDSASTRAQAFADIAAGWAASTATKGSDTFSFAEDSDKTRDLIFADPGLI